MEWENDILYSKLTPPRERRILTRERLCKTLDSGLDFKVILLAAGAGYGKSTLAYDYLKHKNHDYAWYQIEPSDRDPSVFVTYLRAALMKVKPHVEFPAVDYKELENQRWNKALGPLIRAVEEHFVKDSFIVLDDYHEVDESESIREVLTFLIEHMTPKVHFMLLASKKPQLALTKLRARREILEIGESHLAFTPEETHLLFKGVLQCPIDKDESRELAEMTEGWITGLVLSYHILKGKDKDERKGIIRKIGAPSPEISSYFYEIVYKGMREPLRRFTLQTSILSRLQPEFCNRFLNIKTAASILSELVETQLFTISLDETGKNYRYHRLFKSFLQSQLQKEIPASKLITLHRRAAELLYDQGDFEEAVEQLVSAGDYSRAADVLDRIAEKLLQANRSTYLYRVLRSIPSETLAMHPILTFCLACLMESRGWCGKALDILNIAVDTAAEKGDLTTWIEAQRSIIKISVISGKPEIAANAIFNFVKALECGKIGEGVYFIFSDLLGLGSIYLGLESLANRFLQMALDYMENIKEESLKATMLTWCGYAFLSMGEYRKAKNLLGKAFQLLEEQGNVKSLPDTCCFLAFSLIALGEFQEAEQIALKGMDAADKWGEATDVKPYFLQNLLAKSVSLFMLDKYEEAKLGILHACHLAEKTENTWLRINCELFGGIVFLGIGDYDRALECFQKTEMLCIKGKFKDDELLSKLFMVVLRLRDIGEQEAVRESIIRETRALSMALEGRSSGSLLSPMNILLAYIESFFGRYEEAEKALDVAIDIDMKSGGIAWWKSLGKLVMPLLARKFERNESMEFLEKIFKVMGKESLPWLLLLTKSRQKEVAKKARDLAMEINIALSAPLGIKMLGAFEIRKGEEKISSKQWINKKALKIIKYLAAHREEGPVQRDVLMDLFWRDMEIEKATHNLNTALTALRRTLEPYSPWGGSSYLLPEGSALRLNLGNGGYVDIELFRQFLQEAERAERSGDEEAYLLKLMEAEEIYKGDFLVEDLYEDWCLPLREKFRREYINLLKKLAEEFQRRGDINKAIHYVDRLLEKDPCREEWYKWLMELYLDLGDKTSAKGTFDRCRKYLSENLDLEPSQETVDLYMRLCE